MPLTRDWVEAAADLAVTASGGHRTGIACPPKRAVREAASRLFHHPHASASRAAVRATLDLTTGSEPNGSGPTGAGSSTHARRTNQGRITSRGVVPPPSSTNFQEPSACFFQMLT